MILVVSHPGDDHAVAVLEELDRIGHPVQLLDTGEYPVRTSLTLAFGPTRQASAVRHPHGSFDPAGIGAVWWRRPQGYTVDPALDGVGRQFSFNEAHEAISGLWHSLDAEWVNPPDTDEVAHHKPYQLALAQQSGLSIPATLITNDPDEARAFVHRRPGARTVYKTFLAMEEAWRETRVLKDEEVALLDSVRFAPVIFQDYVPAEADLRVTFVGPTCHAAEITTAPGSYAFDYRMDMPGATFRPTELPADVETAIRTLLARLGIRYGAVDLRRTAAGEYVFLEVNPAGEFRFVEERTGQPIGRSVAEYLVTLDLEKRHDRS